MAIIQPRPLGQHVLRLGGGGVLAVGRVEGGDVGADVGEEVEAVAGGGDRRAEAGELAAVVGEDFAVAREVGVFQGGGGEGGIGVEEAG